MSWKTNKETKKKFKVKEKTYKIPTQWKNYTTSDILNKFRKSNSREERKKLKMALVSKKNKLLSDEEYIKAGKIHTLIERMVIDPVKVNRYKNHQSQLLELMQNDIKGATLVLVDMHDDMSDSYDPDDFEPYYHPFLAKQATYEDDDRAEAEWIPPAIKRGHIKKVIWIVPDPKIDEEGKPYIGNVKLTKLGKQFKGKVEGVPLIVTKLDDMKKVPSKNVVLSIDADCLGEAEFQYGLDYDQRWITPKNLANTLKEKVPNPKMVSFFDSPSYLSHHFKDDAEELHNHLQEKYQGVMF